jgi:hypothetical protein
MKSVPGLLFILNAMARHNRRPVKPAMSTSW